MNSDAVSNTDKNVSSTSESHDSQSKSGFTNSKCENYLDLFLKENPYHRQGSGKYARVNDTMEYTDTPVNIKEMVSTMFDDLRNVLADRIAENMCQQSFTNVQKMNAPHSNSSSEKCASNILGTLWEENKNLRFLLCRRYLNFLVTPTTKGQVNTLSSVRCDCWSFFKNSIALLDYLAHFETQKWIEQFTACDKERERLALSLVRLTNKMAQTEAVIRKDPILSGAFHLQIADFTMGNVVTQMRDAYAQLAVAQVLNKELENQLEVQRTLNRKYREELFDLRKKTEEFFKNFNEHLRVVMQESSDVRKSISQD
ncbi:uncharacterized protein LOC128883857 isoform X2 [Hylaeus volcanicus]|uniref:uncharacterized protein LOC128883857 isoform X2 n=1 Tax=Hylaeus volcanicus TaxID=313075 RepID=UPI0023B77950|nr:uncharacterized protein LOC128883857 isoform X2 [Hylaeus volcanicus]